MKRQNVVRQLLLCGYPLADTLHKQLHLKSRLGGWYVETRKGSLFLGRTLPIAFRYVKWLRLGNTIKKSD